MASRKKKPSRAKLSPEALRAARLKNLKPIKPGEVRNPLGKNGSGWLKRFREFWAAEVTAEDVKSFPKVLAERREGDLRFDLLMRSLFRNAALGQSGDIKLAIEQLNGRARQHIEISGDVGNGPPVTFMLPGNGRDVAPAGPEKPDAGEDDKGAPE